MNLSQIWQGTFIKLQNYANPKSQIHIEESTYVFGLCCFYSVTKTTTTTRFYAGMFLILRFVYKLCLLPPINILRQQGGTSYLYMRFLILINIHKTFAVQTT